MADNLGMVSGVAGAVHSALLGELCEASAAGARGLAVFKRGDGCETRRKYVDFVLHTGAWTRNGGNSVQSCKTAIGVKSRAVLSSRE